MNMPGFAAEASLYNLARRHYAVATRPAFSSHALPMRGAVVPTSCYSECMAHCDLPGGGACQHDCQCLCYGKPCPAPGCNCHLEV